jgi:hypothetical protein
MSVNTMTFEQASTLLNAIHQQVTGETTIAATDVSSFISVAQKTLQTGYDPVLNAISQVVGRTIFSIRPYTAKFGGILMDSQKWGAITRKIAISDKPFEDNEAFNLVDGQAIDMYTVNKPNVVQFNYYGAQTFTKSLTIFRNQLDNAFRGPEEFGSFMTMITQNALDMIEQSRESMARMALCNFIAGKINAQNGVIHLLAEYNQDVGGSFTATTIKDPANFPAFVKWVYARIATLTNLMTERSELFQIQVTGNELKRHTPFDRQKVYVLNWLMNNIDARVLADTYNYKFLELADVEAVNYWQAIDTPDTINVLPVVLQNDGTLDSPASAINQTAVMGVIFDEEALGITVMDEFSGLTPMNVKGQYWNQYYSYLIRYYNDFTEKGIVLLLD